MSEPVAIQAARRNIERRERGEPGPTFRIVGRVEASAPPPPKPRRDLETAEEILANEPSLSHITVNQILAAAKTPYWKVFVRQADGAVLHPVARVVKHFSHEGVAMRYWRNWPELDGK
jgi:hypothetical protein